MPASSSSSPARFDGRRETQPALVGDERGGEPLSRRELGGCGAHPRRPLDRLGEAAGADGDDEEVLHVDPCAPRVGAARDHVHHRQRQKRRGPEPPPQGHALRGGRGERARDGHGEHGVRAQPAQIGRAVERPKGRVEARLVGGVPAGHVRRDRLVHGRNGEPDASAAVAIAAVPDLAGLVAAGGRAGRHGRDAAYARGDANLACDRRRAAGVERLPREHGGDTRGAHRSASPSASQAASTVAGGSSRKRVATERASRRSLSVRYSAGDLPSTRASMRQLVWRTT